MSKSSFGMFGGSTGAITTSAALATTYTGLVLTNPINSRVIIDLEAVIVAPLVAQAAARAFGLLGAYSTTAVTQTTPITPSPLTVGPTSSAGYGLLASAATIPTPVVLTLLGSIDTAAVTTTIIPSQYYSMRNNNGDPLVQLLPGSFIAFYTSTASTTSSLQLSFIWSEQ